MNRRSFLVTTLGLALSAAALPGAALAQDRTEDVLRTLRQQGYDEISVGRTWLGRTRITAEGRPGRREIVLNPNTGEILRDFWEGGNRTERGGAVTDDDSRDDSASDDNGSDDHGGDDHGGDDGGGDDGGGDDGGGDD